MAQSRLETVSLPKLKLRSALPSDAASILEIYAPFVANTNTSLEFSVPTLQEMESRIRETTISYPWLICEAEGGDGGQQQLAGYAYGYQLRTREGYKWSVELGVYISSQFRGCGIGSLLYKKLFEILQFQGYFQVIAGISGNDNLPSHKFHEKLGFEYVGKWANVGNKLGKWCDVAFFAKPLQEQFKENPEEPKKYSEIKHLITF